MRIRSIKPEFWRSMSVKRLDRELRLLFIGLWSYADDNGVGIDDYRQVAADLFPLEDDPLEVRNYVRDGLARLSREDLIARFTGSDGKRYLSIVNWHHQRIDKPAKKRFPEVGEDGVTVLTWEDAASRDGLARVSRDSRDGLATIPDTLDTGSNRATKTNQAICDTGRPTPMFEQPPSTSHSRDPRETVATVTGEQGNRGTEERGRLRNRGTSPTREREPRTDLDDIAGTAHSPAAHRHVEDYAKTCTKRPPGSVLRKLGPAVDELLAADYTDQQIKSALAEWGRKGLGTQHLGAIAHELVNSDRGRHLRSVDDIPDDELTREFLDKELGPDSTSPACAPLDIEEGNPQARKAWYRDAAKQRLDERRTEWRRRRGQQNRTSA